MSFDYRYALSVLLVSLLAGCGGGPGQVADRAGPEQLLLEIPHRGSARTTGLDATYEVRVLFDEGALFLGELSDGDDGIALEASTEDPAFARLQVVLTNGRSDSIEVQSSIAVNTFGSKAVDAPSGGDLTGARITRMVFLATSVRVTPGTSTVHAIEGQFQVYGIPAR